MFEFAPVGFAGDLVAFVSIALFVASFGVVILAL